MILALLLTFTTASAIGSGSGSGFGSSSGSGSGFSWGSAFGSGSGGFECTGDNTSFTDQGGDSCSDWAGQDCNVAYAYYGMQGMLSLWTNCCETCAAFGSGSGIGSGSDSFDGSGSGSGLESGSGGHLECYGEAAPCYGAVGCAMQAHTSCSCATAQLYCAFVNPISNLETDLQDWFSTQLGEDIDFDGMDAKEMMEASFSWIEDNNSELLEDFFMWDVEGLDEYLTANGLTNYMEYDETYDACNGATDCTADLYNCDGHCTTSDDCAGYLLCGEGNCADLHSGESFFWGSTSNANEWDTQDSCCYDPFTPESDRWLYCPSEYVTWAEVANAIQKFLTYIIIGAVVGCICLVGLCVMCCKMCANRS